MTQSPSARPGEPALPDDIRLVDDLHLGRPHVIATYVLLGDEPVLVDPGPGSTLETLEAGLAAHGLAGGDLRALLLTHIHLDHAGASGALVARYPHLRVFVHERGAPHMIAPERLISSAARLYGDEMERLWGEMRPVPESNITVLEGGETLRLGGRTVRVFYAPGHAWHHVMYFDEATGAVFTGDVAGVRMPGSPYARPPTPPPDIDIEAWQRSLDTIRGLEPRLLLLAHFGPVYEPAGHIEAYRARLLRWAEFVREGLVGGADEATQIARLQALADEELKAVAPPSLYDHYRQAAAVEQSWQGLARYWRKRAERDVPVLGKVEG
ncbi:MAG: MBL fold metallo-hydrolase [Ardenticatenaceae bacterium]|nr:MBL fold metallo-hydrolase [Ardenticatenaceae bacterium]